MSFKNTKYLLCHFNDLLESSGQPIIKIKHSKVTDDYIAAEEIQNQNWQYFIERVIEVCKSKEIGSTIRKSEDFLLNTVEILTIAKKSYETFYNIVARNFYSTMNKLPVDERDKINDDFLRENFWAENVVTEFGLLDFILLSTWKISSFTKFNFDSKSEFTLFFKNWYANSTCWFI